MIRILNLSNNNLELIISESFSLPHVVSIDLSRNKLESIPPLGECRALVLDLKHNQLSQLPGSENGSSQLVSLDLSYNQIEEASEAFIAAIGKIQNLFLDHNCLLDLPRGFLGLKMLGRLSFHGNNEIDASWILDPEASRLLQSTILVLQEAVENGYFQVVAEILRLSLVDVNQQNEVS